MLSISIRRKIDFATLDTLYYKEMPTYSENKTETDDLVSLWHRLWILSKIDNSYFLDVIGTLKERGNFVKIWQKNKVYLRVTDLNSLVFASTHSSAATP